MLDWGPLELEAVDTLGDRIEIEYAVIDAEGNNVISDPDLQHAAVVRKPGSLESLLNLTTDNGRIEVNMGTGKVKLIILAEDQQGWEPGLYIVEHRVTKPDGSISQVVARLYLRLEASGV